MLSIRASFLGCGLVALAICACGGDDNKDSSELGGSAGADAAAGNSTGGRSAGGSGNREEGGRGESRGGNAPAGGRVNAGGATVGGRTGAGGAWGGAAGAGRGGNPGTGGIVVEGGTSNFGGADRGGGSGAGTMAGTGDSAGMGGGFVEEGGAGEIGGSAGESAAGGGGALPAGGTGDSGGTAGQGVGGGAGSTAGAGGEGLTAGSAGAPSAGAGQGGQAGQGSGGDAGTSGSGGTGEPSMDPGFECPIGDPESSHFCIEGAAVHPGESVRLDIVLILRAGCRRVSQSGMDLKVSDSELTLTSEPVAPRQCLTVEDCVEMGYENATFCEYQTVTGVEAQVCQCGTDNCSQLWAQDCMQFRQLTTEEAAYTWYHFADHSSCQGIYLYEGVVGGLVVDVPADTPAGDYVIDVTRANVGGDNFTDDECESELGRGAIIRVE